MISLVPLGRLIGVVAVLYAVITLSIFWFIHDDSTGLGRALGIALSGSTVLNSVIIFLFAKGWRWVWRVVPQLNEILFPDLNGTWTMKIHWNYKGNNGISSARAIISQNFLKIGMDVDAEDSESETLMAKAKKDIHTGRPILFYMYETRPKHKVKNNDPSPYRGASELKLNLFKKDQLNGNYFTSVGSYGHFELQKNE